MFVIDNTGTWRASGAQPELVGKNDLNTPDADGKLFVKEIVAIDKNGWVDYKFRQTTRYTTRVRTSCGLVTSWLGLARTIIELRGDR